MSHEDKPSRLRCFGRVVRRNESKAMRNVIEMIVEGKRRRSDFECTRYLVIVLYGGLEWPILL